MVLDDGVVLTWSPTGTGQRKRTDIKPPSKSSLPYGASIGLRERNTKDVVETLRQGLPISSFESLQSAMDVSAKDLAQTASIAVRTLARRKKEGRLHKDESERLLRISALFDRAVEVLESREDARHWFKTPKRALGGSSPFEYADTEPGAREVEDLLGRLEYGVFS